MAAKPKPLSNSTSNVSIYPDLGYLANREDDVGSAHTEDGLLGSETSTETLNSRKKEAVCCSAAENNRGNTWRQYVLLSTGLLLIFWGIGNLIKKPFDFFMEQRIEMIRGLPPFEWWLHPPDEVLLKIYIFNVTNSEEFMNGTDNKIKVNEIGPIIYREKLIHTNPIFNENSTLTYTANRTAIFLPELNTIDLNSTIIMPNLGVLLIPSFLYDAPFFTKFAVNLMMRTLKSEPFMKTTIHNYLWNVTDPILDVAKNIAPSLVPTKNVAILNNMYQQPSDNVTVFVGSKYGHENFFLIDKYDGTSDLPFGKTCSDKIANSSEGVSYPQYLTKNDTLRYWRKTLCRVGNLHFAEEVQRNNVKAFKYDLSPLTYYRTQPSYDDCYQGVPTLPNGLADAAPCYFGMPVASSFPHYLYGDEEIKGYVEGLSPDVEKHGSFVVVEPLTGIPLHGIARSQSNLIMRNMRGFNDKIQRFSDISIPLVWLEYNQVGIPWYIEYLIYFVTVVVPKYQHFFTAFLFLIGGSLIVYFIYKKRQTKNHLIDNKTLKFETEMFLKM